MIAFFRRHLVVISVGGALALAGASGFFVSQAFSVSQQAPTETTTVNVGTGVTGPPGPPGAPGAESCPTGSKFEAVEINHASGHITIWTCVANG